jgi:hypothetical protein
MNTYRVTKYNPKYRDKEGAFTKDDWTSISDIGKTFENKTISATDYKTVENKYINAIKLILIELSIEYCTVESLFKNELDETSNKESIYSRFDFEVYSNINEGDSMDINKTLTVARLMLREDLWGNIESPLKELIIEFGYDYYMYFKTAKDLSSLIPIIEHEIGLFVEEI